MIRIVSLCALVGLIQGCATSYSCGQYPDSGCQPVSEVYEKTNGEIADYRKRGKAKAKAKEATEAETTVNINIGTAHRTLNYVSPGDPILTKPVTMRILVNNWIDKDNDLNAGGFVFIKVKDSQWVIN